MQRCRRASDLSGWILTDASACRETRGLLLVTFFYGVFFQIIVIKYFSWIKKKKKKRSVREDKSKKNKFQFLLLSVPRRSPEAPVKYQI